MSEEDVAVEEAEKQERFDILENLTEAEKKELAAGYPYGTSEPKHNVHTFLNEVKNTKDTTKVGFLKEEELGIPSSTVRNHKEMALIADAICDNPFLSAYFIQEAENTLSTSLSREGKLINLAVLQKKVIEDVTKTRKPSSSWFKKKEPAEKME